MAAYRALIVDDEASIRRLETTAMRREGFDCDAAGDGVEAAKLLEQSNYDVVITDLQMPSRHGHALASDLLHQAQRPLVVVLTGVAEPRLAKDLLARGVDDIVFKPVNFQMFAAKVKSMVDRRRSQAETTVQNSEIEVSQEVDPACLPVAAQEFFSQLKSIPRLMPISHAALDVYNLAMISDCEIGDIVAAMQRDASLTAETLRLANSSFFNGTGRPIVLVHEAILRIGQKRVGELALATSALRALTSIILPWMNMELAWKRSLAAAVAVELLAAQGGHEAVSAGLMVSALMHPMGRVVLGTLFPKIYENLAIHCRTRRRMLTELETKVFPEPPGAVVAGLLESWKLPSDICRPLKSAHESFELVARLPEPMRTRAELLKVGVFVAQLASETWEPWDTVDAPPESVLRHLNVNDLRAVTEQTRTSLIDLVRSQISAPPAKTRQWRGAPSLEAVRKIDYLNLSPCSYDFLPVLFPAMGIEPQEFDPDAQATERRVIVNCRGTPPAMVALCMRSCQSREVVLVTEPSGSERPQTVASVVAMPCSFASLHEACHGT